MCQEAGLSKTAIGTFARYHHVSACLYFGIGSIEAFLNQQMRKRFVGVKAEAEIHELLRKPRLMDKVTMWPSVLCGTQIDIPPEIVSGLNDFRELRGEVTHQKRHDHSLFADLDATQPEILVDAVRHYQVVILEHLKEAFPYWLLGWNYIGMNSDSEALSLLNNQQFRYSLCALGEKVPAADYYAANEWQRQHMTSLSGFLQLKATLDGKAVDIEPFDSRFPSKPRLTRCWWDAPTRRG